MAHHARFSFVPILRHGFERLINHYEALKEELIMMSIEMQAAIESRDRKISNLRRAFICKNNLLNDKTSLVSEMFDELVAKTIEVEKLKVELNNLKR